MAKQCGPILLTGQLGGISFYKMKGKFYARRKTHHSARRIRTDPKFEKTHKNALDFGKAIYASKLLRLALGQTLKLFADNRVASRITGRFANVVHTDTLHPRGSREVANGNLILLKGLEFNKDAAFARTNFGDTLVSICRAEGLVSLTIPAAAKIAGSQLVAGVTCIDFKKSVYTHYYHNVSLVAGQTAYTLPFEVDSQAAVIVTLGVSNSSGTGRGAMTVAAVCRPLPANTGTNQIKRSIHTPRTVDRERMDNLTYKKPTRYVSFHRARESDVKFATAGLIHNSHETDFVACIVLPP